VGFSLSVSSPAGIEQNNAQDRLFYFTVRNTVIPGSAGILPAFSVLFCEILWLINLAFLLLTFAQDFSISLICDFAASRLCVKISSISLNKRHSL
jgi:hypothetical protein